MNKTKFPKFDIFFFNKQNIKKPYINKKKIKKFNIKKPNVRQKKTRKKINIFSHR